MSHAESVESNENPFSDSSHTFIYYPSPKHKAAARRIIRGLESRCGLLLLTGEIGIGKTTLCKHIKQQTEHSFYFVEQGNPYLTPVEQLYHFCQQFGASLEGVSGPRGLTNTLVARLESLNAEGQRPVIVIDESHLMSRAHFGQVQILSNFRYDEKPLVQILLVGQLELMEKLTEEGLEALNQRIGIRCKLSPLSAVDTEKYIQCKLEAVQRTSAELFVPRAIKKVWQVSGGLPRLINHICAHAYDNLLYAGGKKISYAMVAEVSRDVVYSELFMARTQKQRTTTFLRLLGIAVFCIVLLGGGAVVYMRTSHPVPETVLSAQTEQRAGESSSGIIRSKVTSKEPLPVEKPYVVAPERTSEPEQKKAPVPLSPSMDISEEDSIKPVPDHAAVVAVPEKTGAVELETSSQEESSAIPPQEHNSVDGTSGGIPIIDIPQESLFAQEEALGYVSEEITSQPRDIFVSEPSSKAGVKNEKPPSVISSGNSSGTQEDEGNVEQGIKTPYNGESHAVVGAVAINAVAWSESQPERLAVLDGNVLHVGDSINGITLVDVQDQIIILEFKNILYSRKWR